MNAMGAMRRINGFSEKKSPVIIIDNWCNPNVLRAVSAEWPDPRWPHWHRYGDGKLATKDHERLPPAAAEVIRMMAHIRVDALFNLRDSFPDLMLHGAGMHCQPSGSRPGIHIDAEAHPLNDWVRTVSAVLYCEPTWKPEWGGKLVIWRGQTEENAIKIEPRFNRLVLFETPGLYHGVPEPIRCPEGVSRKSLAMFFWKRGERQGEQRSAFLN